eukprot:TRINITY_DN13867_c0_g1_i4.p1 TRINITY_DN13867_c0_g1~~TRINITY_DN13867_c0_g1_i4.p1  ORF type:complete len:671 (+),score=115.66 TRINITY_DN13867_c0_g1_i4:53-2065(+)
MTNSKPADVASASPLLKGATLIHTVKGLEEVPTAEALSEWLKEKGLSTEDWGEGSTKDVKAFWKEIKLEESGLELWKKADSSLQPVRVTHVLRAKVSSPERYKRGIFVFNTWQQYESGKERTRNGLLSEKLSTAEIPIEPQLREVCQRAMNEEMQRVVESNFRVGPDKPPYPKFDPNGSSGLTVVNTHLIDHTIEIEISKSFPGLMTVYHLYTVDIICSGMPDFDFNTLEYKEADADGTRKLKYVHAWVWLEWPQIRRYLFEGSKLAEHKGKGSFENAEGLRDWLGRFIDLGAWGSQKYKSVEDLYKEVENQETDLELYSREDGVPLLMRVVHILQMKVTSPEQHKEGRYLFQTWVQRPDSAAIARHRFLARKISMKELPVDAARFERTVRKAVLQELSYVVHPHFNTQEMQNQDLSGISAAGVKVEWVEYLGHRVDVEESPSFKGMNTLYHIYTAEVNCTGLPQASFASLDVSLVRQPEGGIRVPQLSIAKGWVWATWQECLDAMHGHWQEESRRLSSLASDRQASMKSLVSSLDSSHKDSEKLEAALQRLVAKLPEKEKDPDAAEAMELVKSLRGKLESVTEMEVSGTCLEKSTEGGTAATSASVINSLSKRLPPSMIAKMAENTLPKEMLQALAGMIHRRLESEGQEPDSDEEGAAVGARETMRFEI